jgi:hypothetical protein
MKKTFKLNALLIIVLSIITSCTNDPIEVNGSCFVKCIVANDEIVSNFIYNYNYKLVEDQSFYYCSKYNYDDNGRLIKQEVAIDPDIYSSTNHSKSELMTSENSTFTVNYIYEYNTEGKLVTQKNYVKKNDQFEYTSMNSFEYDGDKIVKWNLYDNQNTLTQYYTYEYDDKGNVIKQKQYSFLTADGVGTESKLVSEISFKFDTKKNPFVIYKQLGHPGLYTNPNNIIESNSISYDDPYESDKLTTSKTTYQYNSKGYPTKSSSGEEYKYK